MEMNPRYFKNKYLNFIFTSDAVEAFMFSVLCATVFTAGMCHWILDVGYKYIAAEPSLGKVDFNWVFVVCAVVSIYYLIRKRTVQFDFALVVLCQTFVLAGVMDYHSERYDVVPYAWILPMAYMLGKVAVGDDAEKANYRIEKLYFVLAIAVLVATSFDFLMAYKFAAFLPNTRPAVWPCFWLGITWENRVSYELGFILMSSSFGYLIYCAKRNIFSLVVAIQCNLIIQYVVSDIGGRTNRVDFIISLILFVIIIIYDKWNAMSIKMKQTVGVCIMSLLLIVAIVMVMFFTNAFNIHDKYLNSVWALDGGIIRNVRFLIDWRAFLSMIQHPLEDYSLLLSGEGAHSMVLQYGRIFGFTIWSMLTIFRLLIIKDAIIMLIDRSINSWIKYLLIPSFVAINLYYSMEPNGYAHRHFWSVGLLVSGMIGGWLEINYNMKANI